MFVSRTVNSIMLLAALALAPGVVSATEAEAANIDIYGDAAAPAIPDTTLTEQQRRAIIFHRPTLVEKIYRYFAESNDVKPAKKFDFSVIGGPYYSSDTKLGIGIVAAGLYRRNPSDTVNPAGQVNIYGDLSITKYYKIGIRGSQYFSV